MRIAFLVLVLWAGAAFSQIPASLSTQEQARGLLENSLKDKNPDTRKHAVESLGLVSPE